MDGDLLREAIDLLRKLEYVEGETPIDPGECPWCAGKGGHWDGCLLWRFLEKAANELGIERTPTGPNWDDPKHAQVRHPDPLPAGLNAVRIKEAAESNLV